MICVSENIPLSFEKDLFPVRCIAYLTVVIFSSNIDLSNLQKFASVNCQQILIKRVIWCEPSKNSFYRYRFFKLANMYSHLWTDSNFWLKEWSDVNHVKTFSNLFRATFQSILISKTSVSKLLLIHWYSLFFFRLRLS